MIIEQANARDIPEITEIDRQAFGSRGVSEEMVTSQLKMFPEGMFVAREDSKVVGVVCCERHLEEAFPTYGRDVSKTHSEKGNLLYLSVITVAEEFRNKGIGSLLLGKVSGLAKTLGIARIYCPVNKRHPYLREGVLHFWRKNGYEIAGETNWEISSGKFLDSYVLERIFGD